MLLQDAFGEKICGPLKGVSAVRLRVLFGSSYHGQGRKSFIPNLPSKSKFINGD